MKKGGASAGAGTTGPSRGGMDGGGVGHSCPRRVGYIKGLVENGDQIFFLQVAGAFVGAWPFRHSSNWVNIAGILEEEEDSPKLVGMDCEM